MTKVQFSDVSNMDAIYTRMAKTRREIQILEANISADVREYQRMEKEVIKGIHEQAHEEGFITFVHQDVVFTVTDVFNNPRPKSKPCEEYDDDEDDERTSAAYKKVGKSIPSAVYPEDFQRKVVIKRSLALNPNDYLG
jgi:hypothetical protein